MTSHDAQKRVTEQFRHTSYKGTDICSNLTWRKHKDLQTPNGHGLNFTNDAGHVLVCSHTHDL